MNKNVFVFCEQRDGEIQKVDDLRLNGNIQRGDDLVADDERRLKRQ